MTTIISSYSVISEDDTNSQSKIAFRLSKVKNAKERLSKAGVKETGEVKIPLIYEIQFLEVPQQLQ